MTNKDALETLNAIMNEASVSDEVSRLIGLAIAELESEGADWPLCEFCDQPVHPGVRLTFDNGDVYHDACHQGTKPRE